jgi:hypothetical protein
MSVEVVHSDKERQRRAELRMTQPMNLRMFFGVAWLPIGLEWGYWSLEGPKMLAYATHSRDDDE